MANDLPDYESRVTVNSGPQPGLNAIPGFAVPGVVNLPAATGTGAALGGLGAELQTIAARISDGIQHTKATQAMSGFLTDTDNLKQKYLKDEDYATSEARFSKDLEAAKLEKLAAIDDPVLRSRTELQMKRASIEGTGTIRANNLTKMTDIGRAGLDTFGQNSLRIAVNAASDVERVAAINEYGAEVNRNVSAGIIDHRTAVTLGQKFKTQLDTADAMKAIQRDPAAAVTRLMDPTQFPALDPVSRQSYIQHAQGQAEGNTIAATVNHAAHDPVGAALTVNRAATPSQSLEVFDKLISKVENGPGQVDAVSPKGALGLAQIMPATAREVAAGLGIRDVAALSDDDLRKRLLSDGDLNLRLGRAYWDQLSRRYDGNIALAAAAYNGGMGRADQWKAKAEKQFGTTFTVAELQSVIDVPETKDYISKVYKAGGAPMDARFTPTGIVRAATGVGAMITQQQAQQDHVIKLQASAERATTPMDQMLQDGLNVDPAASAAWRAKQQAAADRGDAGAANVLRSYDQALQMHPYVQQAWKTSPAALDGLIANLEHAATSSPNVSAGQVSQLKAFKAVRDEVAKRRDADPISLGERGGFYPPVAIDPDGNPDAPAFRAALAQRGAQAVTAQKVYLGSAAALKPEEAAALKARYDGANADDKFRMVQALAATLPQQVYTDTLKQIAGSDGGTQFVGILARTRPELAREIFHGMSLANTEGVKNKMGDVRSALADKLGGQIYVSPDQQGSVVDAALALYTARRAGSGNLYDATDSGAIEKALEDVTGPIVKRNGVKTAAPPGMTAGQFTGLLDGLDDHSFDQFGGAYDRNGKPFTGAFLSSRAVLRQLEPGGSRYAVVLPQGPGGKDIPVWQLQDPNFPSVPLVIDVSKLKSAAPPAPTPYQSGRSVFKGELNQSLIDARNQSTVAP